MLDRSATLVQRQIATAGTAVSSHMFTECHVLHAVCVLLHSFTCRVHHSIAQLRVVCVICSLIASDA